jgi:DNA/RNA-binding domain of Phe-tRNA-synthetase-like protein
MKILFNERVFEIYSYFRAGVLIVKDTDNSKNSKDVQDMLRKVKEEKKNEIKKEEIPEIPSIAKWREIYKSFGANPPSEYRNSAEALLRRVFKSPLPEINNLVDLYNYISLKYTLTVGGEDLDKVHGNIALDFAIGNEEFVAIGSDENKPPKEGEVVYKDDKGVICRCWNWREGDRTKLTKETKNAVLVIESNIKEDEEKLSIALKELKELVEKYCGGKTESYIIDKKNTEIKID